MQCLDRAAQLPETDSQELQELRMTRPTPELAKIIGRLHNSLAQMMHPDTVNQDARRERMLRHGPRQFQAATPLGKEGRNILTQGADKSARYATA